MKIKVLTGPQGGGKSARMREDAIANTGLYLFALPTHDLIEEQERDFFRAKPRLRTFKVHSASGRGSTARRLSEARAEIAECGLDHAVVFTTHATLMDHTLKDFDGWHARIDEAPGSVTAGRLNVGVMRAWFKSAFRLVNGPDDEWSAIEFAGKAPNWKEVQRDQGAVSIKEFIAQARRPHRVFVRATSWDDQEDIDWFSIWTPRELSDFASVWVAGSGYTNSVGYKAAERLFSDQFGIEIEEVRQPRTGQPKVSVHYFREAHDGSTTYWKGHDGLRTLVPITDYLGAHLSPDAFWSGNEIVETVMMGRLSGTFIKPMAAGLNEYREACECAFIFSARAVPDDKPLKDIFGLTDADIEKAREAEAIAQFVMRGAIRNSDYARPYRIYLYSKVQAEQLAAHLNGIGLTDVEIASVETPVLYGHRERKVPIESPDDREAKEQARRQRERERGQRRRAKVAIAANREPGQKGRPRLNRTGG